MWSCGPLAGNAGGAAVARGHGQQRLKFTNLAPFGGNTRDLGKMRRRSLPEPVAIWQQVPGAQLCIIPNAAHGLHMEKPELFKPVVLDFVLGA